MIDILNRSLYRLLFFSYTLILVYILYWNIFPYTYPISSFCFFFSFLMTWLMIFFETKDRTFLSELCNLEKRRIEWFIPPECCISCCLLSTQTFKRNGSCLISIQTNRPEISAPVSIRHRFVLTVGTDVKKSFLRWRLYLTFFFHALLMNASQPFSDSCATVTAFPWRRLDTWKGVDSNYRPL